MCGCLVSTTEKGGWHGEGEVGIYIYGQDENEEHVAPTLGRLRVPFSTRWPMGAFRLGRRNYS